MNIFEQASIQKLRFQSVKGELTVEQLWDLPLQSRNQFDLDTIAKSVNRDLKNMEEESFVSTRSNPAKSRMTLMLEILKHIISVKMQQAETAREKANRAEEKEKLLRLLEEKQTEKLRSLSAEEIAERIKELG